MANRFWVGGTGTWDAATTTHWAATSGGAGGQSVPSSGDFVTFDAASGGGTVTTSTNPTIVSLTWGAFTGIIDFSVNNNNLTTQIFNGSGSGTRTFRMGSGLFTLNGGGGSPWDIGTITNLTWTPGTANILISSGGNQTNDISFGSGALSYNAVTITNTSFPATPWNFSISGDPTFASLTMNFVQSLQVQLGHTFTITGALTINNGSSTNSILITTNNLSFTGTISLGSVNTVSWCAFRSIIVSGAGSLTANNSFNLGGNTGITINAPAGSSSSSIIGA